MRYYISNSFKTLINISKTFKLSSQNNHSLSISAEPGETHICKHALKFLVISFFQTQSHIHVCTQTSKDEWRLVRASHWAVLSDYLWMADPLDTPCEVIIHKRVVLTEL